MRRKLHGQSNQGTEVSLGWYINEIEDFVEFESDLNPGNVFCAHPCSVSFKDQLCCISNNISSGK